MLKKICCAAAAGIFLFVMAACTQPREAMAAPERWSLATASSNSNPYILGGLFTDVVNKNQEAVNLSAQVTPGWVANVPMIDSGEMQVGQITLGDLNDAYAGAGIYDREYKNLRGLFIYGYEPLAIVTLDENIKTVEDLKGKSVHIGSPGSSTAAAANIVLESYGVTHDDFTVMQYTTAQAAEALKDGQIDAAFIFGVPPVSIIAELALTRQIYILQIDDEHIKKVSELSKGAHNVNIIRAGDYKGVNEDIHTIDFRSCWMANKDLSEDHVYALVKAVWENLEALDNLHHGLDGGDYGMSIEKAYDGMSVPLHPGAEKYYREAGVLK